MDATHVYTTLAGVVLILVGAFVPGLQDAVSQLLVAAGALVTAIFGGHAAASAHRSLK